MLKALFLSKTARLFWCLLLGKSPLVSVFRLSKRRVELRYFLLGQVYKRLLRFHFQASQNFPSEHFEQVLRFRFLRRKRRNKPRRPAEWLRIFAYVSGLIRAAKRAKNKFRRNLFPALHTNFRAFHISPLNYLLTIIILSYAYIVNVFVSLSKTSYSLLLLKVAKRQTKIACLPCFSRYFDFAITSF